MGGDSGLRYQGSHVQPLPKAFDDPTYDEHAQINGSGLECCPEAEDPSTDGDAVGSSQQVSHASREEGRDGGRDQDGRYDQAMNGGTIVGRTVR